jgi:methylphosphotriester-DNA--protein-cysteine methyltransferase
VIAKTWRLVCPDGEPHESVYPGTLGGHRRTRIYGRLDCGAAQRAIARGDYRVDRVFFLDETTAIAAGYRPCAVCMAEAHARLRAATTVR